MNIYIYIIHTHTYIVMCYIFARLIIPWFFLCEFPFEMVQGILVTVLVFTPQGKSGSSTADSGKPSKGGVEGRPQKRSRFFFFFFPDWFAFNLWKGCP